MARSNDAWASPVAARFFRNSMVLLSLSSADCAGFGGDVATAFLELVPGALLLVLPLVPAAVETPCLEAWLCARLASSVLMAFFPSMPVSE